MVPEKCSENISVFTIDGKKAMKEGNKERRKARKRRKEGKRIKLTQYGQYAEQNGYQGMNTHSHPPSTGFALRINAPGITPTRLQHAE